MGLIRSGSGIDKVYGTAHLIKTEPTIIQLKTNFKLYKVTMPRRTPFPIIDKVERELKRMESEGIITKHI